MAKKKTENVESGDVVADKFTDDLSSFLEKSLDVKLGSLRDYGNIPYWINTRCIALNWVISNDFNGGFPGTYLALISGEPGKGKSLLLDVLLGSNVEYGGTSIKAAIERGVNFNFTSQIVGSADIASKIRLIKPKDEEDVITIEKLTSIIYKLLDFQAAKKREKNKSVLLGIDSVTQLTSLKEIKGVEDRASGKKEKKDMTSTQEMRKLFRTIEQRLENNNMTIIGIGQLTANIPTGSFVPVGTPKTVVNVKGSGFNYASSLTIQVISDREIVDLKAGVPIGIRMRMKTTKNRVKYKGRDCWVCFYFNRGIDRFGGFPELLSTYGVIKAYDITVVDGKEKRKKVVMNKSGLFEGTPTFIYTRSDGTEVLFNSVNISEVLTEEILNEINVELNKIYDGMLSSQGITASDYLKSDDPEEENDDEEDSEEQ